MSQHPTPWAFSLLPALLCRVPHLTAPGEFLHPSLLWPSAAVVTTFCFHSTMWGRSTWLSFLIEPCALFLVFAFAQCAGLKEVSSKGKQALTKEDRGLPNCFLKEKQNFMFFIIRGPSTPHWGHWVYCTQWTFIYCLRWKVHWSI